MTWTKSIFTFQYLNWKIQEPPNLASVFSHKKKSGAILEQETLSICDGFNNIGGKQTISANQSSVIS